MEQLAGKVAFVSGGAGGIGVGMAKAFLDVGMKVALADVRRDALMRASEQLAPDGPGPEGRTLLTVGLDVTDRDDWARAAREVEEGLGPVDLLCSNAGVNFMGPTHEATFDDWDFCLGVNLGGAVNAVRTFVPRMLSRGGGGHVVITSSIHGIFTGPFAGVYATSKYALAGLGESLRVDLAPHGVGVSVLCPGPIRTGIFDTAGEVRPADFPETTSISVVPEGVDIETTPIHQNAMDPDEVGRRVVMGVTRNDLYIMTHPEFGRLLEARAAAMAACQPDEPIPDARAEAFAPMMDTHVYGEQAAKPRPKLDG